MSSLCTETVRAEKNRKIVPARNTSCRVRRMEQRTKQVKKKFLVAKATLKIAITQSVTKCRLSSPPLHNVTEYIITNKYL